MNRQSEVDRKNLKICVIRHPTPKVADAHVHTFKLLKILEPLAEEIFLITGNFPKEEITSKKFHIININTKAYNKKKPKLTKMFNSIIRFILTELRISYTLITISKNIDTVIFSIGTTTFISTMLLAKLLRKKTILAPLGSASKTAERIYDKKLLGMSKVIFPQILATLEKINCFLSEQIIVESENTIQWLGMDKYRHKISSKGELFIDTDLLNVKRPYNARENIVGYTGSLSPVKGIMNLVKAIPMILEDRKDIKFVIGGRGVLFEEIKDELKKNGLFEKVALIGWIPRDELPGFLNQLKLFVLLSYTEGGTPITVLEAMACGTPVLTTPVGGVPDVITDGENGFILEDDSPESIAKNVIRALDDPKFDQIAKNAHDLINREYTYEKVVENYRKLLIGKG